MKGIIYTFLFLLFLGLYACGNKENRARFIPAEALGVFSLNTGSLTEKVAWSYLADSRVLHELSGQDSTFDISKTGIDPNAPLHAFGLPETRMESGFTFMLILPLKSHKIFENYLRAHFPKARFEERKGLQFAFLDDHTCIGWDKATAISAFNSTQIDGDAKAGSKPGNPELLLENTVKGAFSLPETKSIMDNKWFRALQKEKHDISYWFNYEAFAAGMPQNNLNTATIILNSQKKLIKDTYLAGGLDFEKGKIVCDGKYYINSSAKAIAEAFSTRDLDRNLIQKIPGRELNLLIDLHMDPGGIRVLIDSMGMLPLTRLGLQENGLSPDSVLNVFKGNFLLSVADLDFSNIHMILGDQGNEISPFLQAALSFEVRSEVTFQKILHAAEQLGAISLTANGLYKGKYKQGNYYLGYKENYVVVAAFPATVTKLLNYSEEKKWDLPKEIGHKPFAFYFDFQTTMSSFFGLFSKDAPMRAADGLIEHIIAYTDPVKAGHIPFHAEISFQNKSENSLLQLIRFSKKWRGSANP